MRVMRRIGGIGFVWALCSVLGALTADRFSGAAAVYVPVGAAAAFVIRRATPAWHVVAGVLVGQLIIGGATSNITPATFVNSFANGVEVLLAARIIVAARAQRFDRERDVLWLAIAASAGALVGAAVGSAYGVLVNGDALAPMFRAWFAADFLGMVLIVPGASITRPQKLRKRQTGTAVSLLLLSCVLAVAAASPAVPMPPVPTFAAWFVMLLVILFAGVRVGVQAMAVVQAPVAVAAFESLADADPGELLARQGLTASLAMTLAVFVLAMRRQTVMRLRSDLMGSDLFHLSRTATAHVRVNLDGALECISVNAAFTELIGPAGMSLANVVAPQDADRIRAMVMPDSGRRSAADVHIRLRGSDDFRLSHVEIVPVAPLPGSNTAAEYLLTVEVMSEERRLELERQRIARTDLVTGLLNRRGFIEELNTLLTRIDGSPVYVAALEVESMFPVSDKQADASQDLERQIAQRLIEHKGQGDSIARIDAAEFAVASSISSMRGLAAAVAAWRSAFDTPFMIGGEQVWVTCSIGSSAIEEGDSSDAVLLRALNARVLDKTMRARTRR